MAWRYGASGFHSATVTVEPVAGAGVDTSTVSAMDVWISAIRARTSTCSVTDPGGGGEGRGMAAGASAGATATVATPPATPPTEPPATPPTTPPGTPTPGLGAL